LHDYAATAPIESFLASQFERHPTDVAKLAGARLAVADEIPPGRYWDETKIKRLTGGDTITARFMRQDFFEFEPTHKLALAGNSKPRLHTIDEAIKRRIHLIPFTVTIPKGERDADLPEKLAAEHPGILSWLVEGCLEWQRIGLAPPASVLVATEAYLDGQDATATWIEDCCDQAPDAWASREMLFSSWSGWATRAGERIGPRAEFLETLRNRFEEAGRNGVRGFRGIQIKPPSAQPERTMS
jgi:putative DNA primase/helicase